MTYKEAIRKAASLKDIGQTDIYLMRDDDLPWHLATGCVTGGLHRLSIPVSVAFLARDAETGLTFRWSLSLERREANGKGHYDIDREAIFSALAKLPRTAADQFRSVLRDTAKAVQVNAEEYVKIAATGMADAALLRALGEKEYA